MSDIYMCVPDKDGECDWKEIDEELIDLESHDANVRAEAFKLVAEKFGNDKYILVNRAFYDKWVEEQN